MTGRQTLTIFVASVALAATAAVCRFPAKHYDGETRPATYYIAPDGDDSRAGTAPESAWRSLARATRRTFQPGERLLLQRGGVWNEGLRLRGRAPSSPPILVGAYGQGPRPCLNGGSAHGLTADGPISGWRISGLELTSANALNPTHCITGGTCGIFLAQEDPCEFLAIWDCVIHDTSGRWQQVLTGSPQ